jgi:hypothetical protein
MNEGDIVKRTVVIVSAMVSAMLIMTFCICVSAYAAGSSSNSNTGTVIKYINGDADGDGDISIFDATCLQRLLAEMIRDTDGMIAIRGDVDKNGLSITDATLIQRYLAGFPNNHQIGTEMNAVISGNVELPEKEL